MRKILCHLMNLNKRKLKKFPRPLKIPRQNAQNLIPKHTSIGTKFRQIHPNHSFVDPFWNPIKNSRLSSHITHTYLHIQTSRGKGDKLKNRDFPQPKPRWEFQRQLPFKYKSLRCFRYRKATCYKFRFSVWNQSAHLPEL